MKRILSLLFASTLSSGAAHAAVTLLDKDDWKVQMGGFIESDIVHDSTRGLNEVVGAGPVARPGTAAHDNGQTAMSIRNSRLAFTLLPPVADDFKSKGYFEFDLLGYDPKPNANGTSGTATASADAKNSESGFYTNPTMRVRHAYFQTERAGWTWLAGQTWTLFGWQPNYFLTTASVPPGPGSTYQRTEQLMGMKTLEMGGSKLQIAASVARPSQRDSETPNLDAGVRWSLPGYTSTMASYSGDAHLEALSVGLSGTWRQFVAADSGNPTTSTTKHGGQAVAVDVLVPIIPAKEDALGNSLTLTSEWTAGTGYGDAFPSWTGGLSQYPQATNTVTTNTNLDAGQGGFDSTGGFALVKLQTMNAQLQYHLPGEMHTFLTVGYAKQNAIGIGRFSTAAGVYDQVSQSFVNIFHDCTKQIRTGLEYSRFSTHYLDGKTANDDRVQLSGYFRF